MNLTPHFKTIAIKYSYSLALAHPYWDTNSCLLKIDIEQLKKDVGFWRAIIRQVECDLEKAVKLMLREKLARQHFNPFADDSCWAADIVKAPDFIPIPSKGKVEGSRDPPPKIFIPIPKIESNGCARSDSLICSLIFSERFQCRL